MADREELRATLRKQLGQEPADAEISGVEIDPSELVGVAAEQAGREGPSISDSTTWE